MIEEDVFVVLELHVYLLVQGEDLFVIGGQRVEAVLVVNDGAGWWFV
jgi:hypothetical protein